MKQLVILMVAAFLLATSTQAQLTVVWEDRYDGDNSIDQALAVTADDTGNTYVTGLSRLSGNIDVYTIKYDPSGNILWQHRFDGSGGGTDWCEAIAVDKNGNCFVAGKETSSGNGEDLLVIKYSPSGSKLWDYTYDLSGANDQAYDIGVTDAGNIYVCGRARNSSNNYDYVTIKLNTSGTQQWATVYDAAGNADQANAIAVNDSGHSYVTGQSDAGTNDDDMVTIKYNDSGVQQWLMRHNGSANDFDIAYDIAMDANSNVYVIGESQTSNQKDFAMIKYSPSGSQLLLRHYNHTANNVDRGYAIDVDASGNIYACGDSWDGTSNYDYATVKWNSAGTQQWVARYDGGSNLIDEPKHIRATSSGDVYTGGTSFQTGPGNDYAVVKYNSAGSQQWAQRYHNTGTEALNSMFVHDGGNVIMAGSSDSTGTSNDFHTISYCATPTANAGSDTGICQGGSVQLNASGGLTYAWWPTTGLSNPSIANPVATPTTTTAYQLTVTNGTGCWALDTITITVTSKPTANAGSGGSICAGDSIQLNGSGGSAQSWNPSTGLSDPNIGNPWASPTVTTTYTMTASNGPGCDDTASVTITVTPVPASSFTCTVTGDSASFTDASTNATSWFWDFGDGNTSTSQNPSHTYTTDSTYMVCQYAINACDSDSTCKNVVILTTGLSAGTYGTISVLPNPVKGGATIYLRGLPLGEELTFELMDVTGRRVYATRITGSTIETPAAMTAKGLWFFRITDGSDILSTGKLVVQ